MTQSPYTTLTQDASTLLRLVQRPTTTILQQFTPAGCLELELNDAGLQAFLCALPPIALAQAMQTNQARWESETAAQREGGD